MPKVNARWGRALKKPLLEHGEAQSRLQKFLKAQIAPFVAPTDISAWRRESRALARRALDEVYLKGYPAHIVRAEPRIVWGESLRPHPSYRIRKLRYEIYPDYWIPALLYEPLRPLRPTPVVLNPNGHHTGGKAADYKQIRCANLARRGILALSIEFIGMGELGADRAHNKLAHLDLTGLAGVGLFYLALSRALDLLLARPGVDQNRVAVTGLSGGGWQSIVISALDPRVTLSVPVAGYTAIRARIGCLNDIGDLEQTPVDLCRVMDYQHMTAMLAPRPTLLILNETDDCCFRTERAKPVIYDAVLPTFRAMKAADRFAWHSNKDPGTHNYGADNRSQFYKFLKKHWKLRSPDHDIHHEREVLTEPQLNVGLPLEQMTMTGIALRRARQIVAKHKIPSTAAQRRTLRERLREVLRLPEYDPVPAGRSYPHGVHNRILRVGPWRIPLSAQMSDPRGECELLIVDGGRAGTPGVTEPRNRFVADILFTGENKCTDRHQMLVDTTGQRLLGIMVAQILSISAHVAAHAPRRKVHLIGSGFSAALATVLAAGLRPKFFTTLTHYGHYTSLLEPIAWSEAYERVQPIFCFGLLQVADIPQMAGLLEDVEYRQPGRVVKPQLISSSAS